MFKMSSTLHLSATNVPTNKSETMVLKFENMKNMKQKRAFTKMSQNNNNQGHYHANHHHPLPSSVARRNERERNRVKMVNMGFATLRQHVPNGSKNKKMSKVETLRSAVEYIRELQKLLGQTTAIGKQNVEPTTPTSNNENQYSSDGPVSPNNNNNYEQYPIEVPTITMIGNGRVVNGDVNADVENVCCYSPASTAIVDYDYHHSPHNNRHQQHYYDDQHSSPSKIQHYQNVHHQHQPNSSCTSPSPSITSSDLSQTTPTSVTPLPNHQHHHQVVHHPHHHQQEQDDELFDFVNWF